jgi:uridylate kinase
MAPRDKAPKLLYRRVLVKLSGEALMGTKGFGIEMAVLDQLASDIVEALETGAQLCVVIGGGNIYRGLAGAAQGMDRATGDYMGMLATVMNALALQNALEEKGKSARVLSAIPMPTVCEPFTRARALRHLDKERIVIFAAGTGNPYFTTDTAAALRAAEMNCDALLKATQVDGIYSDDPKTTPNATRFDRLTYNDVLARDLKVMDGAAIALARDNRIPIIVFSIKQKGSVGAVLKGMSPCTTVAD